MNARLKAMYDLEVQELLKPVKPKRKDYYASRIKKLESRGLIIRGSLKTLASLSRES